MMMMMMMMMMMIIIIITITTTTYLINVAIHSSQNLYSTITDKPQVHTPER